MKKERQLSVFLENRTGRINDVTKILGGRGVNMLAFSMAELTDFGILRLIVDRFDEAAAALRAAGFAVKTTDVVRLDCPNTPGALSRVLDYLAQEQVFIVYMYAYAQGDCAHVIIKPSNVEKCLELLRARPELEGA